MMQSLWESVFGIPAKQKPPQEGFYAASGYVATLNNAIRNSQASDKPTAISGTFPTTPATSATLTEDIWTLALKTTQLTRANYKRLYAHAENVLASTALTANVPTISPTKTYAALNTQTAPTTDTVSALGTSHGEFNTALTHLFLSVRDGIGTIITQYGNLRTAYGTFRTNLPSQFGSLTDLPSEVSDTTSISSLTYSDSNVTTLINKFNLYGPDTYTDPNSITQTGYNHTKLLQSIRTQLNTILTNFFAEYDRSQYDGLRPAMPQAYTTYGTIATRPNPLVPNTVSAQTLIDMMTAFAPLATSLVSSGNTNNLRDVLANYCTLYSSISSHLTSTESGTSIPNVTGYTYSEFFTAASSPNGALYTGAPNVSNYQTTLATYNTALRQLYRFTLTKLQDSISLYVNTRSDFNTFQTKFNETTEPIIIGTVAALSSGLTETFTYPNSSPSITYTQAITNLLSANPLTYSSANQTIITQTISHYLHSTNGKLKTLRDEVTSALTTWAATFNGRFVGSSATFISLLPSTVSSLSSTSTISEIARAGALAASELVNELNRRTTHLVALTPSPAQAPAPTTSDLVSNGDRFQNMKSALSTRYSNVRTAQESLTGTYENLKSTYNSLLGSLASLSSLGTITNLPTLPAASSTPSLSDVSSLLAVVTACGPDSTLVQTVPTTIPSTNQLPNVITFIRSQLSGLSAGQVSAADQARLNGTPSAQQLIDIMNNISSTTLTGAKTRLRSLMDEFRNMYRNFQHYLFEPQNSTTQGTALADILSEIAAAESASWAFANMTMEAITSAQTSYSWPASGEAVSPNKWAVLVTAVKQRLTARLGTFGATLSGVRTGQGGAPALFDYPGINLSSELNSQNPNMTSINGTVAGATATLANLHTPTEATSLYSITVRFFQTITISPSPAPAPSSSAQSVTRPSGMGLEQFLGIERQRLENLVATRTTVRNTLELYYDIVYSRFDSTALSGVTSIAADYMNVGVTNRPRSLITDMTAAFNALSVAELTTLNSQLTTGISNMYDSIVSYIRAREGDYSRLLNQYQTFYESYALLLYKTAGTDSVSVRLLSPAPSAVTLSPAPAPDLGSGDRLVFDSLLATITAYNSTHLPNLLSTVKTAMNEFITTFNNAYRRRFGSQEGGEGSLEGVFVNLGPSGADQLFSYRSYETDIAKVNDTAPLPTLDDFLSTTPDTSTTNNIPNLPLGLIPRYSRLFVIFGDMSEKMRALKAMDAWYDKYLRFQNCLSTARPVTIAPILDEIVSYIDVTTGRMTERFNNPQNGLTHTVIAQRFYTTYNDALDSLINGELSTLVGKFKGPFQGQALAVPFTYYQLWVRISRLDAGINQGDLYDTAVRDAATGELFDFFYSAGSPVVAKEMDVLRTQIFSDPQKLCAIRDAITRVDAALILVSYRQCIVNDLKHGRAPKGLKFV